MLNHVILKVVYCFQVLNLIQQALIENFSVHHTKHNRNFTRKGSSENVDWQIGNRTGKSAEMCLQEYDLNNKIYNEIINIKQIISSSLLENINIEVLE